jgi:hypothetical protein
MLLIAALCGVFTLRAAAEGTGDVHAGFQCSEPKDTWQPQMKLQRELKAVGWRVRKIIVMNGCYEVYGFDAQKVRVEAFFNPRTLQRMQNVAPE